MSFAAKKENCLSVEFRNTLACLKVLYKIFQQLLEKIFDSNTSNIVDYNHESHQLHHISPR